MGSVKVRGQSSTEFLLLFAAAVAVFAIIYSVTVGRSDAFSSRDIEMSANLVVTDLSNAAREVHAQGAGARKIVTITLPGSYDPDNSRIAQNAIILRAKDVDYVRTFSFSLQGSLPDSTGTFYWPVENAGTSIVIGDKAARLNRTSISAAIAPGASYSDAILITSSSLVPMSGTVSMNWTNGSATLVFGPAAFTLAPFGTQQVDILVNTSGLARGTYVGQLVISLEANESASNQSFQVPIVIAVSTTISAPAASLIQFIASTPANATTSFSSIAVNATIQNVSQPSAMTFSWNSTNYTMYNDSLVLAYNFDDVSSIGDSARKAVDISRYGNNGTIYGNTMMLLHMDENSSSVAYDEGVYGNNGTCYNMNGGAGVTNCSWVTGKNGRGISFDGTDDYVNASSTSSLLFPQNASFSILFWMKTSQQPSTMKELVSKTSTGRYNYDVMMSSTGNVLFQRYDGTNNPLVTSNRTVNDSNWHLITAMYNGAEDNLYLYVDGALSAAPVTDTSVDTTTSANVLFGSYTGTNYYFNGTMDEVLISNQSLSADEILNQYNAGRARHANWNPNGTYGSAMSFDGVNDYVDAGNASVLNTTATVTIAAWVKLNAKTDYQSVISKRQTTPLSIPYGLQYRLDSDSFSFCSHNGTDFFRADSASPFAGAWYHVAGVFNGTNLLVFLNGVQSTGSSVSSLSFNERSLIIGKDGQTALYPFNGSIDEVRIWNYSLSATEIQQQYYSNVAKYEPGKWLVTSTQPASSGSVWYSLFARNDTWAGRSQLRKITFMSGIVFFQAPAGSDVVAFTQTGDIVLAGTCTANTNCSSAPAGAIAFRDSDGVAHAYITEAGDMCLEDASCSDRDASCTESDNLFVVKNSENATVSYISQTGQMCLVGTLTQNGSP